MTTTFANFTIIPYNKYFFLFFLTANRNLIMENLKEANIHKLIIHKKHEDFLKRYEYSLHKPSYFHIKNVRFCFELMRRTEVLLMGSPPIFTSDLLKRIDRFYKCPLNFFRI